MPCFAEMMVAEMGPKIKVPAPITAYFQWLDDQGLVRVFENGQKYALIDPSAENSCLGIVPPDPDHAKAWVGADCEDRLVPFCCTGGDGSYAAFWVDDSGTTRIVHLGSGSGSTMTGIMVDDAIDFLRLIAIGYEEICWPENHGMTPAEVHEIEYPKDDYEGMEDEWPHPPSPPLVLQQWVCDTFQTTIPERASDILGALPDMDDENSTDPFMQWLAKV